MNFRKRILFSWIFLTFAFTIHAKEPVSHQIWNQLLKKYINEEGRVNYKDLSKNQRPLDQYLKLLKRHSPASDWSREEEMAYWINAYNAFTIKLILDNYPISSITQLNNRKPWDLKWIEIDNKKYSLNDIEREMLLKEFKDARIHFAINSGSISSPPLLNEAFDPGNLEEQLNSQAVRFINNNAYNTISAIKTELSQIFEWNKRDFIKTQSLIDFINRYSNIGVPYNSRITFKIYDWNLNE